MCNPLRIALLTCISLLPLSALAQLASIEKTPYPGAQESAPYPIHGSKAGVQIAVQPKVAQDLLHGMMHAIFGTQWQPEKAMLLRPQLAADAHEKPAFFQLTPVSAVQLNSDTVLLAVNASPASANRTWSPNIADGGQLCLYWLHQSGQTWQLLQRQELILTAGQLGQIGQIHFVTGAEKQILLALESTYQSSDSALTTLMLLEIQPRQARLLTPDAIRLQHYQFYANAGSNPAPENYNVHASWRLLPASEPTDYPDLVVDFSGHLLRPDFSKKTVAFWIRKPLSTQLRYRYQNPGYRLYAGKNLIYTP